MNHTKDKSLLVDGILQEANIKITPDYKGRKNGITTWSVIFRKRNNSDKFYFKYESTKHDPPEYSELLEYVTKWNPGTFAEFCDLQDYNTDSRAAKKDYDEHLRQYLGMTRMFIPSQIKELRELDED